jgi:hypothetical protein
VEGTDININDASSSSSKNQASADSGWITRKPSSLSIGAKALKSNKKEVMIAPIFKKASDMIKKTSVLTVVNNTTLNSAVNTVSVNLLPGEALTHNGNTVFATHPPDTDTDLTNQNDKQKDDVAVVVVTDSLKAAVRNASNNFKNEHKLKDIVFRRDNLEVTSSLTVNNLA